MYPKIARIELGDNSRVLSLTTLLAEALAASLLWEAFNELHDYLWATAAFHRPPIASRWPIVVGR